MIYELEFSPTGGTGKALEAITAQWPEEKRRIDLSDPREDFSHLSLQANDVCFVAVPSFGGRVPAPAAERLKQVSGNGAAAVLLCVFGNRAYDDTLLELFDILTGRGFSCRAAAAAVAQHSIMPQFGSGRPDERDLEELSQFGAQIRESLSHEAAKPSVHVPGNRPYREYKGVPFVPKANQNCTGCGICAAGCPVGAIDPEAPARTDKDRCISCMRCAAICPNHARKLNDLVVFAASQKMKKACSSRKGNEVFLEG